MNLKIHTFVVQFRRELSALCACLAVLICLNVLRPHPGISIISAAHDLPSGHIVQAQDVVRTAFNVGWQSAITHESAVIGHTLTHAVKESTPLNESDLLDMSITTNLHGGMRAVTIEISPSDSLLARVGSRVDVFSADGQQISSDSLVLAINESSSSSFSLSSRSTVSAIVAMTRAEVSQLSSARSNGALTLAVSGT